MFDRASRPTITEWVVESADSAVESADYWSWPTGNWPSGYGPFGSNITPRHQYVRDGRRVGSKVFDLFFLFLTHS